MSYSANVLDLYRRSAVYIDKILRGAKPADLPVEQASKYQLVINLKTAKALGIEVPATLLALADEVIEGLLVAHRDSSRRCINSGRNWT